MVEYGDYLEFVDRAEGSDIARMPRFSNWLPAWKRFAEVWLCAGVYIVISEYIDPLYMTTAAFVNEPIHYKVFHLCMSMQIQIF